MTLENTVHCAYKDVHKIKEDTNIDKSPNGMLYNCYTCPGTQGSFPCYTEVKPKQEIIYQIK